MIGIILIVFAIAGSIKPEHSKKINDITDNFKNNKEGKNLVIRMQLLIGQKHQV